MKHLAKIQSEFLKESALFPSQEALDKYLKDHPEANRSNHRVLKRYHSPNKVEMLNYKELQGAHDLLKDKFQDLVYKMPNDEKHLHFVNNKTMKDALDYLKSKKKDQFVTKVHHD